MPFPKLDADWFWRAGLNPDSALPEWDGWDRRPHTEKARFKKVLEIVSGLGEATIRNYYSEYEDSEKNRADHVGQREKRRLDAIARMLGIEPPLRTPKRDLTRSAKVVILSEMTQV